jgi:glycosyltransferase involved in cell wall biosynthesis
VRRPPDAGVIAVVPAFRTAGTIADVLRRMPPEISQVVVVDDASPDGLSAAEA